MFIQQIELINQYDEKLMFSDVFCDMVNDQVYGTNYPDVTKKELCRVSETSQETMGTMMPVARIEKLSVEMFNDEDCYKLNSMVR